MNPTDAALYMTREIGVTPVPGDNFYATGNEGDRYLRFAFCRTLNSLSEAAERLKKLKAKSIRR